MRLGRLLPCLLLTGIAFLTPAHASPAPLRIGAVFPWQSMGMPAQEEYRGVQIAANLVNAAGGIDGRRIVLVRREMDSPVQAMPAMQAFRAQGIAAVVGAFSSALSIPAGAAAGQEGLVYWEAGAEADRLTGQGYRTVFRVGASGANLGANSATFAATQLASRLHRPASALRVAVVNADDDYARSVADAALAVARRSGMHIVVHSVYSLYAPRWTPIMARLRRVHPDIIILASHVADGVAFRRAMLRAHVHTGALIGSTMAECGPDFGRMLGSEAIGVFASDRPSPMGGFNPLTLHGSGRALYERLVRAGGGMPSEEALSGFSAGWVLFHYVLPRARGLTPRAIAAAARSLNLAAGTLPNGAGVRFAADRAHLGQNTRATSVIWQWQAVRHSVVVWPAVYATGRIRFVPLAR
ncbi:MAG TPA: ABC transporter substrate-binding protein [Chloroflexota bacterium]|nr:ABC transporter substrate-binding protein [Chloroflexota bacterium]